MKDELLYRYIYGRTTEQENCDVLDWLDADPVKHTAELERIHYVCTAADHYAVRPEAKTHARTGGLLRRVFRYSAAAAAAVALLLGVWQLGTQHTLDTISNRVAVMEVPAGQYIKMTLEDGTNVWLNAGSRLEYPPVFEKKLRQVKIAGEALFEVTHDAERPFVVETYASKIEVLGTRFNVFADRERNQFSTTLVEGRVKVSSLLNASECFIMEPHDVVKLVGGHLCKSRTTDFNDLCWTEGLINIKQMPFDELMSRFEKAYDVKIVYRCLTMPQINVMSGEIRISDGIDNALHVLQQVSDFTFVRDEKSNVIEIR